MDMRFRPAHQSLFNNVPGRAPTDMRTSLENRTRRGIGGSRSSSGLTKDIRALRRVLERRAHQRWAEGQLRWPPCPRARPCQGLLPPDVRHPGADGRPVDAPSDLSGTAPPSPAHRRGSSSGRRAQKAVCTLKRRVQNVLASAPLRGESAPRRRSTPPAGPEDHDPFRWPTSSPQPLGKSAPRRGVLQAALLIRRFRRRS